MPFTVLLTVVTCTKVMSNFMTKTILGYNSKSQNQYYVYPPVAHLFIVTDKDEQEDVRPMNAYPQ